MKRSLNDNHNLVAVLAAQHGFVHTAVDQAREQVKDAFKAFLATEKSFLAQHLDEDVKRYVQGLRDCIVGHAHWIYYTDLFFENGDIARDSGLVRLLSVP